MRTVTKSNQGEKQFEGLLSLYLRERQTEKNFNNIHSHLDEDSLSAFVEGALTQSQAAPILKHLIDCILCRRVTAQLAELSNVLDESSFNTDVVKLSNNWREFWSTLTESVFRPYDNVVTAHEEEKECGEKHDTESN